MSRLWALAPLLVLSLVPSPLAAQRVTVPVPPENRPELTSPSPRPGSDEVQGRARALFLAIVRDEPELARDLFYPRDAFIAMKGIEDPGALWGRIHRMYENDIHALHAELGADAARAEFVRFELSRRRSWIRPREESNRLPYWSQRHNWLVYRVGDEERRFEVRTVLSWGERWYITHLREFR